MSLFCLSGNISRPPDIYQRRELHSVNSPRGQFSHEKRKKNAFVEKGNWEVSADFPGICFPEAACRGRSPYGTRSCWDVLTVVALQMKPLVTPAACSSGLQEWNVFPRKYPQQIHHLLALGPWPSYLLALSFHFCICKIEQSYLSHSLLRIKCKVLSIVYSEPSKCLVVVVLVVEK